MLLLSIAYLFCETVQIRQYTGGVVDCRLQLDLASLLSVLPYMLSVSKVLQMPFREFRFTTTGASILSNVESLPRGILF